MSIKLGTKIIGNFGAMHPLWFGEVVATYSSGCKVNWEGPSGGHTWMLFKEINDAVGKLSPIGYYTEEVYNGFC